MLIWSNEPQHGHCGYFWLPNPPVGYKAMGIVVSETPEEPELDEVWKTRPCKGECSVVVFLSERSSVIHALIKHYGPTVFFHPDDDCMPSSVQWFFKNGAILKQEGNSKWEPIDYRGSNLPPGGTNDGAFWIDLPDDDEAEIISKRET
ncbi:hypothetical protein LWI29_032139 [Acer saccharum]|uniref:Uncharacterized protein n=1 Tax=Acer saccharum TaxID=4024 RepID=A0AA39W484_ACESA|nr:hypothetical protein LWI29_032139 [Acer saccharum]